VSEEMGMYCNYYPTSYIESQVEES